MHGLLQRFGSIIKMFFFKDVKGENRLIFNITGLFFVVIVYFSISIGLFVFLHHSSTQNDNRLETDLKIANSIQNELATLSLRQNYSAPTLNQLLNLANSLSKGIKANQSYKLFKDSLTNLVSFSSELNNPKFNDELVQNRVLIEGLVQVLIEKRQNIHESLFSRILICEIGLILLTIFLVWIGVFFSIKTTKTQQSEISYFESLAYQFKGGQLDKIVFNYQGKNLTELNQAISRYIQLVRERYQMVKDQIKNLNYQTNEISLFFKQNDTFYSEVKRDLEQLVHRIYRTDDKYQVLSERIKLLNVNLRDSQQQILHFHESLKSCNHIFLGTPEEIGKIDIQVKNRENYLKKGVGDLYQLRSILEQLLHTGSIFQNVAEQNALLALNASIEAARAETAIGGFDIAAEEIALLAEKVGRVSKELLAVVDAMEVKGNTALKTLETDLARNNDVKHFIESIGNKINIFCLKLSSLLEDVIQYSIQIEGLEEKRKSLEELAASLGELNRKSQNNYGRAEVALDMITKSGETMAVSEQFDSLVVELKHLMNKITI